ncbi:amino acid dehydrogenase [Pedobacter lusitanus]|uniref:Amino acid dehydrogenase n=1 Tax=Pedobacter lusitanus TaxID=1503925 RepID=A0A0D0GV91_9SPHI|nr:FAD-dependent oxidoreductase [Pedobacter lusitanus]KIO78311.1 amino acid dehydrogenase [Pedobacter lusitanus]
MSHIIIIGGGIIGLSSAYYLSKQGHQITILDKGDITSNCSFGNAGMIVPSHFIPLASPGMIQQGIRWMFNSKSPFYVRPSLDMNLIGWGLKFLKHANENHVSRSMVPLRDLSLLSKKYYEELTNEPGFEFELKNNGILAFYKTEKTAEEEIHIAEKGIELGLDMKVLDAAAAAKLQPGLELDVLGAVHYRCDGHLYPSKLMNALTGYLEKQGVVIMRNHEVTRISSAEHKITGVFAGGKEWKADQFVLAAGSWSPEIAKMMDIKVSVMPGKGYSFMEQEPAGRMTIPALLCEARVAVTPMNGSIRYSGTMELDKINARINKQRVQGILEAIPDYFPELKPALPADKDIWFGFRPSSPDGLPYIGRSAKRKNLIVATGHGMMGLSLGPATGVLVSQLINEQPTAIDIRAFSPSR